MFHLLTLLTETTLTINDSNNLYIIQYPLSRASDAQRLYYGLFYITLILYSYCRFENPNLFINIISNIYII